MNTENKYLIPYQIARRFLLLGNSGGRVGEDAIIAFREKLERIGLDISTKAAIYSKHSGRVTVQAKDINLVEVGL